MIDLKIPDSNEVGRLFESGYSCFDPDKRIDVNQKQDTKASNKYEVDKRIEPMEINYKSVWNDYTNDLKLKSECSETILTKDIDISCLERQSPDKVAELREEFDEKKQKLRKEWELVNNREWPKYSNDIYNDNGQVIRRKGDNYDAHHIQPLCLGGKNEVSNITPLDISSHKDIHSLNGSCKKLVDALGGKVNE